MVLFGGAIYDLKEHRIPNWWFLVSLICGMVLCLLNAPGGQMVTAVLGFGGRIAVVTIVFFPLFMLHMMGAGDIKMMALVTGSLGFGDGICSILCGFVMGAVLALIKMLMQKNLQKRLIFLAVYIRRLFLTKEIVPYYQAERDGYDAVIPFTVCLFAGFMWYALWKII